MPGNPAGDEVNVFIQGLNYFLLVYHLHLKKNFNIFEDQSAKTPA
jgi:hypothetical protein